MELTVEHPTTAAELAPRHGFVHSLIGLGGAAGLAGAAAIALGRVWTEPVMLCGGQYGEAGAGPLWAAATVGLAVALVVALVAVVTTIVGLVRPRPPSGGQGEHRRAGVSGGGSPLDRRPGGRGGRYAALLLLSPWRSRASVTGAA